MWNKSQTSHETVDVSVPAWTDEKKGEGRGGGGGGGGGDAYQARKG